MAEYLSRDILEDGLVRSFAPIRLLQMVLGSSRVDARDRFVTSPTLGQKLYTMALLLMTMFSYVVIVHSYISVFRSHYYLHFLSHVCMLIHYVIHASSIIHSRFLNNEANVRFYVHLQEIDRMMRIDRNRYFYDLLFRINFINILVFTVFYCVFSAFLLLRSMKHHSLFALGIFYVQFTCTLEWIFFSNLIVHIYSRLSFINAIILNHLESISTFHKNDVAVLKVVNKGTLQELALETNDFTSNATDEYLNEIFILIDNFTGLYRFQMFVFCFKFVVMTLAIFEFSLLTLQFNMPMNAERIVLPTACVGDFALLILICVRWERFFKEIKETKHLSTTILATYTEGPLRKKAATMLKAIEETPPHFSVYDMWNMDASTLLNILSIITTLTVTLLQFSLL